MSEVISRQSLLKLVEAWLAQGKQVVGPVQVKPGLVLYRGLADPGRLLLDGFIRPRNSIKEFLLPRHETLYGYRFNGRRVELIEGVLPEAQQVILAARPCDAAALPILDQVFNWDCADAPYNHRRALSTVVTLACASHDEHCFCTSVGCGPTDGRGSDAVLLPLPGGYEVLTPTDKGAMLFCGRTEPGTQAGAVGRGPEKRVELEAVGRFLARGFERPEWQAVSRRCLGCGACAYTCPTCHCFDIVDEGNAAGGVRARNWDACQFGQFTQHASGHNPRPAQPQRQRQRIFHKFKTYPEKFGEVLCTGCGNCTRNCSVHLGVLPVLEALEAATATDHGTQTTDHAQHLPA